MKRLLLPLMALAIAGPAFGQTGPDAKDLKAVAEKSYAFYKGRQKADGSFEPVKSGPGTTALIAAALIRHGYGADDPVVAKALAYLEKNVQPDGGVYNKFLANYTTCIALVTFKEANKDGKYDKVIANAATFLKTLQQAGPEDAQAFGGVGYDGKSRPDVSNSHFYVEALLAAGVPKDDPSIKNAITFLSRCQNLPGEANKMAFATKTTADDKGGFVYNPFDVSKADSPKKTADGGMTYAGLKSFLYAGIGKDDPRVKAAVTWIREHYTLDENPGQKDSGLFYYYHVFAKAMTALGEDEFADAKGKKHPWKAELFDTLKKKQKDDGSWANDNGAFLENSPELATSFALLAISYTGK